MPLHPYIAAMLKLLNGAGWAGFSTGTPDDARALLAAGRRGLGTGPELPDVRPVSIATRAGSVPARLYRPAADTGGAAVPAPPPSAGEGDQGDQG